MKLSAVLLTFFAGAIMAAPVPDNSIHERGRITPSTPIEERGIAGGLVKDRGLALKKPVVERARLTPSVPIEKRGEALVKKPVAERGAAAGAGGGLVEEKGYGRPIAERGRLELKHPIEERGTLSPDVGTVIHPDVVVGAGPH
ncbi:hypothetical protein BDV30DRAFT_235836 [Aspergillus minisclerotigenes]|uniref:Uncharacterized protein n=1 Tax=Aspergillus minisclerotigenes TaxID=656917 RepID=A0A5N6JC34_9EURO|nr:hypothetical protein BDV30DRAFT_235836 [Aspergillus minisclerotigenes]